MPARPGGRYPLTQHVFGRKMPTRKMNARSALERLFREGLRSVNPEQAVSRALRVKGGLLLFGRTRIGIKRFRRICALGAGKAATGMLSGLMKALPRPIDAGLLAANVPPFRPRGPVEICRAGHPVPDRNGLAVGRRILNLASSASEDDLVFVLISGGASAMTPCPPPGVSLSEIRETTRLLLASGAPIYEVNTVRRHISRIAGGQLARALFPAASITLLLSDVIGDDLEAIGSGPTVPDPSTFQDAWDVLSRRRLLRKVPRSVAAHLRAGRMGIVPETPKPGDPVFKRARTAVVASNRTMLSAIAKAARTNGLSAEILTDALQGEARDVGAVLADLALARSRALSRPLLLAAGGETTVRVSGKGIGGRNQEMALGFADRIRGAEGITALFAGTDGQDGNSTAAGGWANGGTAGRGERALGVSIAEVLSDNNSTQFLSAAEDLFVTGPTGTNVRDAALILIDRPGESRTHARHDPPSRYRPSRKR